MHSPTHPFQKHSSYIQPNSVLESVCKAILDLQDKSKEDLYSVYVLLNGFYVFSFIKGHKKNSNTDLVSNFIKIE